MAVLALNYLARQSIDWPSDSARYAERGFVLATERGLVATAAWLAHLWAQAHVHQGEWGAADALLDRAEAHLAERPDQPFLRMALAIVRAEGALGRGELARVVETLEPLLPEVDERQGRIHMRMVRVALARALLAGGDAAAADAALAPLVDRWVRDEEGPFMLSALLPMAAAEIACALGDPDGAERWSAELAALGSGPRADYARGLAELTRGSRTEPPTIEDAACAVEADGRRWEGGWMRIIGADAAGRADDANQACRLAAAALERVRAMEADGWCRRCEASLRRLGLRVPGHRTPRGPGGLTAREAEVLALVVNGLSNRAIAERLFISEGTAARHVANVFTKLGAHSRLEAARIAVARGLLPSPDTV
jgi:ATP/maltotriose-dependent transcriptional regulator MalT